MIFLLSLAVIALFAICFNLRERLTRAEQHIQWLRQHGVAAPHAADEAAAHGAQTNKDAVPPPAPSSASAPARASPWAIGVSLPERLQPRPPVAPEPTPAPIAADAPRPDGEDRAVPPMAGAEPEPRPMATQTAAPPLPYPARPAAEPKQAVPLSQRFELIFGKMLPIWAGGLTLAIAGVLIVRYAIDAGFFANIFTPIVQVITAILFGLGLIGGAEYAYRNEDKVRDMRVSQALAGAGIATLFATILVASNVYLLISPTIAFIALAAVTAGALGLSLRLGAPSALLGLIGGLAAPAMVGAAQPNVPLLALYLGLTVAGLAGLSRQRGWTWLALGALLGGSAWGVALSLAGHGLSALDSLSVGAFILLLGVALPLLALDGVRRQLLQSVAAIMGALQMALLVYQGGFTPLHWGLFILIAGAGQWMAWRDRTLALVPSVGLLLAILLLGLAPTPAPQQFALIGLPLLAIFAGPLIARLWTLSEGRRPALELCAAAVAPLLLMRYHYDGLYPLAQAALALLGAGLTAAALARGWRVEARKSDERFAYLTAATAFLLLVGLALLLPDWLGVIIAAGVTTGLVSFAAKADDQRIERVAGLFLVATVILLIGQSDAFLGTPPTLNKPLEMLRWASTACAGIWLAWQARRADMQRVGQAVGAFIGYGAAAVMMPDRPLALLPALAAAGLLVAGRRWPIGRLIVAVGSLGLISLLWAGVTLQSWLIEAQYALAGQPMLMLQPELQPLDGALHMLLPGLLFAGGLWLRLGDMRKPFGALAMGVSAAIAVIGAHILYRGAFAALVSDDFTAVGIAQRLIWAGLLMAGAWAAHRKGARLIAWPLWGAAMAHILYFSLLWHNPLWAVQAVGPWPIINMLLPLYALPFAGLLLARQMDAGVLQVQRGVQWAYMLLTALFAWSLLRQAFHGSLLTPMGVTDAENILRSILLIGLALGYLLWGMKRDSHDWRIASLLLMIGAVLKVFLHDASGLEGLARIGSFVALGFSLIGIGWLYSRQLAGSASAAPQAEPRPEPAPPTPTPPPAMP